MRGLSLFILLLVLLNGCATTKDSQQRLLYYRVKVQMGESLAQIAQRFDTTWQQIVSDNNLSGPNDIKVGMTIKVRPGPGGYLAGTENMPRHSVANEVESANEEGFFARWFGGRSNKSSIKLTWPVKGKVNSKFGRRNGRPHEGIDISGRSGDPIYAAASGVVKYSGRGRGYGKMVTIDHGSISTLYAHLSAIDVAEGDVIKQGDIIGRVGETGHATGPHLHFEVRDTDYNALNPLAYLHNNEDRFLYSAR